MLRRRNSGNSMVEFALGIGCVMAVCMLVMGGLGFAAEDTALAVLQNINAPKDQAQDPSNGSNGGIFTNGVSGQTNTPWTPR